MNVLDLFSGIGGFSLGLERAGMKTVAFCEIDKHCQKVLKKHWPDVPIFEDVKKLKGKDFKNIDLICGGFPCQDISIAGKMKGLKGERSGLWKEFFRVIKEIKPRYVIVENVANLRSKGLNQVLKDIWSVGYDCEWHIISASSIGALHKRERIWIVAYPDKQRLERFGKSEKAIEVFPQEKIGSGVGRKNAIRNSSGSGCNGCSGEERYLQADKKWNNKKTHSKGEKREPVTGQNGQILSKRGIENIKSAYSDQWELVSRVHRVTYGLSKRMDKARRERIKQLGNAVVPQIPELIGKAIMEYEKQAKRSDK